MSTLPKGIVRFSLAESDYYFREILLHRLTNIPALMLISKCNNGHELINRLYKKQEDFFLIDMFMPVLSGIETVKFIRHFNAETPIIIYASTYQKDVHEMLEKYGNIYYCKKNSEVIETILRDCVLSQGKNYPQYLNDWSREPTYIEKIAAREPKGWYTPTILEIQLMKLCYEGLSNKEMGQYLNLSARTVDTYINRLTQKLGLRNKIDLIRFSIEHGFYNTDI